MVPPNPARSSAGASSRVSEGHRDGRRRIADPSSRFKTGVFICNFAYERLTRTHIARKLPRLRVRAEISLSFEAVQQLVVSEDGLSRVVEDLENACLVGFAVEMQTRASYRPQVCLLSMCVVSEEEVSTLWGIDARAVLATPSPSRERFLGALSDARVVTHGGEYAMAALRRELRVRIRNFVDTQQAAILLGLPRTGLEALRTTTLGLPPREPSSIVWGEAPIGEAELAVALSDVRDLPAIYDNLMARIRAKDLDDELMVASALVEDPLLPDFIRNANIPDPKRFKQIPGASLLNEEGLRVLEALVKWRDSKAQSLDLPSTSLFANTQLIELASAPARAPMRIAEMGFHSRLVHSDRAQLRNVVIAALSQDEDPPLEDTRDAGESDVATRAHRPRKGTPTAAVKARLARLKDWRRIEAERREVGLQAILPAVSMEHLAFFPRTPLVAVPGLGRRRIERYGQLLSALVAK